MPILLSKTIVIHQSSSSCLTQDMEAPLVNTMEQPEFRCPWINQSLSWYCPSESQWLCYFDCTWVEHYDAFTHCIRIECHFWIVPSKLQRKSYTYGTTSLFLWSKIWEERNARIFKDIAKSYKELNKPRIILKPRLTWKPKNREKNHDVFSFIIFLINTMIRMRDLNRM